MYLTENQLSRKKSGVWQVVTIKCVTYVKKVLDLNFNQAVFDKISIFHDMPQISHTHYSQKS